jgi:hypothetical protein
VSFRGGVETLGAATSIFSDRVLQVGAGLLGVAAPPAGPTIDPYGSAEPWPWHRFL